MNRQKHGGDYWSPKKRISGDLLTFSQTCWDSYQHFSAKMEEKEMRKECWEIIVNRGVRGPPDQKTKRLSGPAWSKRLVFFKFCLFQKHAGVDFLISSGFIVKVHSFHPCAFKIRVYCGFDIGCYYCTIMIFYNYDDICEPPGRGRQIRHFFLFKGV